MDWMQYIFAGATSILTAILIAARQKFQAAIRI